MTLLTTLGLDLGTHTGWAKSEGSEIIGSGVRDFSLKSGECRGKRGVKFYNFLLTHGRVDEIYVEKVAFSGNFKNKKGEWITPSSDGRQLYHGFLMLVEMYAAGFGIPVYEVNLATLKKRFTGNGHATKEEMCMMAHQLGWQGGHPGTALYHDEVDACALVITEQKMRYNTHVTFRQAQALG